jgi:hypothetical protein
MGGNCWNCDTSRSPMGMYLKRREGEEKEKEKEEKEEKRRRR